MYSPLVVRVCCAWLLVLSGEESYASDWMLLLAWLVDCSSFRIGCVSTALQSMQKIHVLLAYLMP